jgi:hypothetical protein
MSRRLARRHGRGQPHDRKHPRGGEAVLRRVRVRHQIRTAPSPSSSMTTKNVRPSPSPVPVEDEAAFYRHWITQAAEVCERAARGDLEARLLHVPHGGDLGRMLLGINHLLDMTDALRARIPGPAAACRGGQVFPPGGAARHARVLPRGRPGGQIRRPRRWRVRPR